MQGPQRPRAALRGRKFSADPRAAKSVQKKDLEDRVRNVSIPREWGNKKFGDYALSGKIGSGGMGEVWQAFDPDGRKVALKLIKSSNSSETARERFRREIASLKQVKHDNIVEVYDFDIEGEIPFYTMEFLPGNIETKLNVDGEIVMLTQAKTLETAFEDVLDAAYGLKKIHDSGFLHRDIKPSNMRRDSKGNIKLTDFGLALDQDEDRLTKTDHIVGSYAYWSPEKWEDGDWNEQSDIYALGISLYQLVTGFMPFDDRELYSMFALKEFIQNDKPIFPSERLDAEKKFYRTKTDKKVRKARIRKTQKFDIDDNAEKIIMKAMHPDPKHRYSNIGDMIADIEAYLDIDSSHRSRADRRGITFKSYADLDKEKYGWFKRRLRDPFVKRNSKMLSAAAASVMALFGVGYALFSTDEIEETMDKITSIEYAAVQAYNNSDYALAFKLIKDADSIASGSSLGDAKINQKDKELDTLVKKYGSAHFEYEIKSEIRKAHELRLQSPIKAEREYVKALSLVDNLQSKNPDYSDVFSAYSVDIKNNIEVNKKACLEELVRNIRSVDSNSKEFSVLIAQLFPRVIDYKIRPLLSLPKDKFPDYVKEDGTWNLCSGERDSGIGCVVDTMLMAYDVTKDDRFLSAAKDWAASMKNRWMANNMSSFGEDYMNSYVKLLERDPDNPKLKDVIINAADALVDRFHPVDPNDASKGEFMQATLDVHHKTTSRIIATGTLAHSKLLHEAYEITKDKKYLDKLKSNLDIILKYNKRDDGSFFGATMLYLNNPNIHRRIGSHSQYNAESSRSLYIAEAIESFMFASEVFKDEKYLRVAQDAADFMLAKLSKDKDGVLNWNYDNTVLKEEYNNTHAGSKLINALNRVSQKSISDKKSLYDKASKELLRNITLQHLNLDNRKAGLIDGAMISPNQKALLDATLFFADHAYLRALKPHYDQNGDSSSVYYSVDKSVSR